MTQTPRPRIYKYMDIPEGEHFSQDRPSLERACGGNCTRGKILDFFVGRACYVADKNGLEKEQCTAITIFVEREEILKALRISEPTYIAHLKALNGLTYVKCPRYARGEYIVNLVAVNSGIAEPPTQIRRGRPKGTDKSLSNKRAKKASTFTETPSPSEIALTLPEIALTSGQINTLTLFLDGYRSQYEEKVKAISCEVEELREKVKAISENPLNIRGKVININTFQEYFKLSLKYFKLLPPDEALLQAAREAFSEPLDYLDSNEIEESSDAPFVASPPSSSFASENESHSQQELTLPIASRHYETSTPEDVTHVSQESEIAHGHIATPPHLFGDDQRGTAGTQHPLSAAPGISVEMGREELGRRVHGYEKGVRDEPGTTGIRDRDAGGAGRDTALPPAPDQHFARDPQEQAVQETPAAQEVAQQTPLSQGLAPALDGDTRESSAPPVATTLLLSHTPFYDIDVLAEDTWDALPGWTTETVRASAATSLSDATSQPTETATMKPASQNKTVQASGNKKTRSKAAKLEKPIVPAEPKPDPLLPEERELFDAWNSIFEAEVPLGPVTIETVQWLNKPVHTWARLLELSLKETLDDMRKSCYAKDKKDYFKKNGVRLYNLKDNFEGWQSMKQEELRKKREQEESSGGSGEPRKVGDYYFYQPETRKTRAAAPLYPQVAASAPTSIAFQL